MENYNQFIQNILETRGRFACGEEYCERHHIIPKCMGGTDEEDNLIDLYAKEHYEAHRLLAIENPNNHKLIYAWWCMSTMKSKYTEDRYEISADEYEESKRAYAEMCSIRYTGDGNPMYGVHRYGSDNPMYGVHRYGEENPMYGKRLSDEAKRKIGEAHKKENLSEETLKKISEYAKERFSIPENNPMYGKNHTEETRQLMSEKAKARCTDEWREKTSKNLKGKFSGDKNPNYGNGQPVVQINENESVIGVFISASTAEKYTGVLASSIRFCCVGKYRHASGYRWHYLYDQTRKDGTIISGAITLGLITEAEALAHLNTPQND